jgi:hypothetical protein
VVAAPTTKQDLDSSDDELPEEYLRPGDVVGYFEGVFGDKRSYQEAQIIEIDTQETDVPMKLHNRYVKATGCLGKSFCSLHLVPVSQLAHHLIRAHHLFLFMRMDMDGANIRVSNSSSCLSLFFFCSHTSSILSSPVLRAVNLFHSLT